MKSRPYNKDTINDPIDPLTDERVLAAEDYVTNYMQNLSTTSSGNFKCPIVFYNSRETLLDYANRTKKDIVVQNGGWIGKYYPLLAKTAYEMLFNPDIIYNAEPDKQFLNVDGINYYKVKQFINMTTYPVRNQVKDYI